MTQPPSLVSFAKLDMIALSSGSPTLSAAAQGSGATAASSSSIAPAVSPEAASKGSSSSSTGSSSSSGAADAVEAQASTTSSARFQEISQEMFDYQYSRLPVANRLPTGHFQQSGKNPIASIEIASCITIFGKNDDSIFGYHIQDGTSSNEIIKVFDKELGLSGVYSLYIIGGDGSDESNKLLNNIHTAIEQYFDDETKIIEELINQEGEYGYIDAAIELNGALFFCRHN